MRYGSIGWSVGAVLGYCKALTHDDTVLNGFGANDKRVLAFIGDGSFQVRRTKAGVWCGQTSVQKQIGFSKAFD